MRVAETPLVPERRVQAPGGRFPRFVDPLGHVQQGLGRDAAAIEADPARMGFVVYKGDIEPEVGGLEGGDITAGAAADSG